MDRPLLSVCLIARDAESWLPDCLDSIASLEAEVVVVDTGSIDATPYIAREHACQLSSFPWCDDFSAARNASIERASGEWLFFLDADERLTPEACERLLRTIAQPTAPAYTVRIFSPLGGHETIEHRAVRLVRNDPELEFRGAVHEQLNLGEIGWTAAPSEIRIEHLGYDVSHAQRRDKSARDIALLEGQLAANPNDAFAWWSLACAMDWADRTEDALVPAWNAWEQAIEPQLRADCSATLVGLLVRTGKATTALKVCDQAFAQRSATMATGYWRACALAQCGALGKALEAARHAEGLPHGSMIDPALAHGKLPLLRAQCCIRTKDFHGALAEAESALKNATTESAARLTMGMAYASLGKYEQAVERLSHPWDATEDLLTATRALAHVCSALDDHAGVADACRKLSTLGACDDDLFALWVKSCEALGDSDRTVEAYREYTVRSEPGGDMLIEWGRALAQASELDRAEACFVEAIRRSPEDPNAYFNCGDLLTRMGRFADAAHLYETGLRLKPGHANGWFVMGNCLAQLGLTRAAVRSYEEAIALDPALDAARHNLDVVRSEG